MSEDTRNVEDMKTLLEEADIQNIREHEVVEGTVVQVNRNEAFVDIGYKQEIPVPKRELAYPEPESAEDVVKVGDKIEVYIQSLGGENGGALSKVKADRMVAWRDMEAIKDREETVEAKITGTPVAVQPQVQIYLPATDGDDCGKK